MRKTFDRPAHDKDDGHAHIKFGQDPKPNLQKYGYCIVENVFTNQECDTTIDSMWSWLEGLGTGIKRNDKSTWNNGNWPHYSKQGMLQHTLGHEEFMWKIREHISVLYLFYQIYGTFDLLVSFDGATIGRPPETGYTTSPKSSWIHTDQNVVNGVNPDKVHSTDKYCVQGIANFEHCGDDDGCLFVGEGSHLLHSKLFVENKQVPKDNWYIFTEKDIEFMKNKEVKFIKTNAPKGSMILFDSRCAHSGYPSQNNRAVERFRYVIYVSMAPAIRATQKDIDKKIKAIRDGKTTTHWSSNNTKIFPLPQTYGKLLPYLTRKENIPDYQNWSQTRKQLAGLRG